MRCARLAKAGRGSVCLALIIAALTVGCAGRLAPTYDVTVTARSLSPAPRAASYRIEVARTDADSALLERVANRLSAALNSSGMFESEFPEEAEFVVTVSYAIGPPGVVRELRYESVSRTTGGVIVAPVQGRTGASAWERGPSASESRDRPVCVTAFLYEKSVWVALRKNDRSRGPALWRVDVSLRDERTGLRNLVPMLVTAAMHYTDFDSDGPFPARIRTNGRPVDPPKAKNASEGRQQPAGNQPASVPWPGSQLWC